jgi:alkanesulfonate monooxygenase SsuD/methylene tetrahydromethanopterin reductase-like flavin-dependent oxidoreductase (luciferase family)
MSLPDLEKAIGFLRQTAQDAGRDPQSLSVALRTGLFLTEVSGRNAPGKFAAPWEQSATFAEHPEHLPFRGSVAEVIDDIREAQRIGVDHLIFESPVQRNDERFDTIEAFAQDVLPAFRTTATL